MSNILESPELWKAIDSSNMIGLVESFGEQCLQGEQLAREFELKPLSAIDNVVICGMGGSAIGGDLLKAYASQTCTVPIEVIRNYTLPHYVNQKTLVIAGSYSGNTEETLSTFEEANEREAKIVGISTGGKLEEFCQQNNYPCLKIPSGYPPRAALGYSFIPLAVFFERWGFIPDQKEALQNAYEALNDSLSKNRFSVSIVENPAKQMAQVLQNSIVVIYAGQDAFEPIATRWRCQFNENTKTFAHNMVLPEMNHNEILGWMHPEETLKNFQAVFLLDEDYHPQTKKRFEIMKTVIQESAQNVHEVHSRGRGLLARMLSMIHLGDFVSVYLAGLYHQDPTPIPAIDYLKSELAK